MKRGAIPIPIDISLSEAEIKTILDHCGAKWLFRNGAPPETLTFSSTPDKHPEDIAVLIPTSGTTAGSKVIAVTPTSLLTRLDATRKALGLDDSLVCACMLPLAHALFYPCLTTWYVGGALVVCPPFNLKTVPFWGPWIGRYAAHTTHLIPPLARVLVQARRRVQTSELSSLRFMTCVSSPLEPKLIGEFEKAYGIPLLNCYGLKETGFIAFTSQDLSSRNLEAVGEIRPDETRIVDKSGRPVPPGNVGEVVFKTDATAPGFQYYRRPDLNKLAFKKGWFYTGDMGRLDEQGRLYLHGRINDLIICRGRKVNPEEVEEVLRRHEADLEAAASGMPNSQNGQKVVACFVMRPGGEATVRDIITHCRRYLADYKCPVRIKRVAALPRGPLGKVHRPKVRGLFPDLAHP